MIAKKPIRTLEFGEQDEDFIKQLARDIGCHYCKANERTYNLNKFASDIHRGITCFPRDTQHAEDSVCFDTQDGYQKTIRALRIKDYKSPKNN